MAQRVTVFLVDDIDGTDADNTVSFSLDGVNYEIDLSAANQDLLAAALAPFIGAARTLKKGKPGKGRVKGRKVVADKAAALTEPVPSPETAQEAPKPPKAPTTRKPAAKTPREEGRAARAWAVENGVAVPLRGRVPAEIVRQYHESQNTAHAHRQKGGVPVPAFSENVTPITDAIDNRITKTTRAKKTAATATTRKKTARATVAN